MAYELIEMFSDLKKTIYKHDPQKYDMSPVFQRITKENLSPEDLEYIHNAYLYVSTMYTSMESIGTKIIELQRYAEKMIDDKMLLAGQTKFEEVIKEIFGYIDSFIDSLSAFSRMYQIKGQEFEFVRTIMELRSKRDLLMKLGNEYNVKLMKTGSDSTELQFFLGDFLDSLLNEAYRLQISKILKTCKNKIKDVDQQIEELY